MKRTIEQLRCPICGEIFNKDDYYKSDGLIDRLSREIKEKGTTTYYSIKQHTHNGLFVEKERLLNLCHDCVMNIKDNIEK